MSENEVKDLVARMNAALENAPLGEERENEEDMYHEMEKERTLLNDLASQAGLDLTEEDVSFLFEEMGEPVQLAMDGDRQVIVAMSGEIGWYVD